MAVGALGGLALFACLCIHQAWRYLKIAFPPRVAAHVEHLYRLRVVRGVEATYCLIEEYFRTIYFASLFFTLWSMLLIASMSLMLIVTFSFPDALIYIAFSMPALTMMLGILGAVTFFDNMHREDEILKRLASERDA